VFGAGAGPLNSLIRSRANLIVTGAYCGLTQSSLKAQRPVVSIDALVEYAAFYQRNVMLDIDTHIVM
jgi:hypothetical protein